MQKVLAGEEEKLACKEEPTHGFLSFTALRRAGIDIFGEESHTPGRSFFHARCMFPTASFSDSHHTPLCESTETEKKQLETIEGREKKNGSFRVDSIPRDFTLVVVLSYSPVTEVLMQRKRERGAGRGWGGARKPGRTGH